MALGRRFPLYIRPVPALACGIAMLLGWLWGPNWSWDWALQTGNIFILIHIGTQFVSFTGIHILWLSFFVVGLAGFVVFGRTSKSNAEEAARAGGGGFWAPRARFYPLVLLFGLFLLYFGTVFLFKASVTGDQSVEGLVAFVYLNYDGILNRAVISIIGGAILALGTYMTLFMTVQPGLGFKDVRPMRASPSVTRDEDVEGDSWQPVTPAPRPQPVPLVATKTPVTRPAASPTRAPSTGRPSSASRPVRSPASQAPPARTATTSKRPSKA